MAFQAINFIAGSCLFVLKISNIGMAIDAIKICMVFNKKTTCRIMYLGAIRIAWWLPIGIIVTFHAGLGVSQVLGKNGCSESNGQQGDEQYKTQGFENYSNRNHVLSSFIFNENLLQNKIN
jgi:hypothetical protein